jgi:hypothetical protein
MAKKFWVNTGHTLYHGGQYVFHACREIPEEIVSAIIKAEGSLKRLIEAGSVVDQPPQHNPATDPPLPGSSTPGAPSQQVEELRPVTSSQSQAGPSLPPALGDAAPVPPPAGGAAPQTDATGKALTDGLTPSAGGE